MGFFCTQSSGETSKVINELPDYLKEPVIANLKKAGDVTSQPYQTYDGQRIADFTQDQQDAFQGVRDMQGYGSDDLQAAMGGLRGLTRYDPNQVSTRSFDSAAADEYMNPYVENVLDRARQRIFDADDIARQGRDARAISSDAFGGDRAAIVESEAQKNLGDRIADMEAKQLANAYTQGANIFAQDQNRALTADRSNQMAGLQANQQNIGAAVQGAKGIGALANLGQQMGFQQNQALQGIGTAQQGMDQSGLDLAYQDFLSQRQYPMQQVAFMSDILQGTPSGSMQTQIGPPGPSPFQSALGLGIAGLGIYGRGGGFGTGGFSMDTLFGPGGGIV